MVLLAATKIRVPPMTNAKVENALDARKIATTTARAPLILARTENARTSR